MDELKKLLDTLQQEKDEIERKKAELEKREAEFEEIQREREIQLKLELEAQKQRYVKELEDRRTSMEIGVRQLDEQLRNEKKMFEKEKDTYKISVLFQIQEHFGKLPDQLYSKILACDGKPSRILTEDRFVRMMKFSSMRQVVPQFAGFDMRNVPLGGLNLSKINFTASNFSGMDLSYTNFSECQLELCDFSNCDLIRCNFTSSKMKHASFQGATLSRAIFMCAAGSECNFADCKMDGVDLFEAKLSNVTLKSNVIGLQQLNAFYRCSPSNLSGVKWNLFKVPPGLFCWNSNSTEFTWASNNSHCVIATDNKQRVQSTQSLDNIAIFTVVYTSPDTQIGISTRDCGWGESYHFDHGRGCIYAKGTKIRDGVKPLDNRIRVIRVGSRVAFWINNEEIEVTNSLSLYAHYPTASFCKGSVTFE